MVIYKCCDSGKAFIEAGWLLMQVCFFWIWKRIWDEVTSEDDNFSGTIHLTGRCFYESIIHVFGTWKNAEES
jgi:hypothetical protein